MRPCACVIGVSVCSQKPHLRVGLCSSPRREQQPVPPTAILSPELPHFEPPPRSTGAKIMRPLLEIRLLAEATHQQAQCRLAACRQPKFSDKKGLPTRHVSGPCLTSDQPSPRSSAQTHSTKQCRLRRAAIPQQHPSLPLPHQIPPHPQQPHWTAAWFPPSASGLHPQNPTSLRSPCRPCQ
jgi:hypothetical protein